jgi:flagellar biosynthesis protein FliR
MLTDIVTISAPTVQALLLALLRVGGFIATAPALSHRSVPISVRVGLSPAIAWAIQPRISAQMPAVNELLPDLEVFALHQIGVSRAD